MIDVAGWPLDPRVLFFLCVAAFVVGLLLARWDVQRMGDDGQEIER